MSAVRRYSHFSWGVLLVLGIVLLFALYFIKAKAQVVGERAEALKHDIAKERAALSVLRSEMAFLESPSRLQSLSAELLDLRPTDVEQTLTLSQIIQQIPLRPEPALEAEARLNSGAGSDAVIPMTGGQP